MAGALGGGGSGGLSSMASMINQQQLDANTAATETMNNQTAMKKQWQQAQNKQMDAMVDQGQWHANLTDKINLGR